MKDKIYILTAVHNDLDDTKRLLRSIYSQDVKNFEVFLVDDGSSDGTHDFISNNYPKVRILTTDEDLWWTGSLNLGLKSILTEAKKNDFVWIVNNDCYFSKSLLGDLYNFASHCTKSIVGSLIVDSKTGKIVDEGVNINWKRLEFKSGGTDALSTKGTLYPVQVFKDVGLFDAKHFPHYFSDYEFSIRAKRRGYELVVCKNSRVYNKVERTGLEVTSSKLNLAGAFNLLFSKKSKVNLLLQVNMIRYVCPKEFKLRCSYVLLTKIIRTLGLW